MVPRTLRCLRPTPVGAAPRDGCRVRKASPARGDGVPRAPMHADSAPQGIALRSCQRGHQICAKPAADAQTANRLGSESERARHLERLIWASTHVWPTRGAPTPLPPSSPLRNREETKTAAFPRRRQRRHHRRDTPPKKKRVLTQNTSVTTNYSTHLKTSHPTLPRVSNRTQRPGHELSHAGRELGLGWPGPRVPAALRGGP